MVGVLVSNHEPTGDHAPLRLPWIAVPAAMPLQQGSLDIGAGAPELPSLLNGVQGPAN